MKSIFKYILTALLPLLIWIGCGRESVPSRTAIPDHCIEITIGGIQPSLSTKTTIRGEDTYHENTIENVDCFFYPEGGTGSPAVFTALGRGANAVPEGDSVVYKVRVFFTDSDALSMFGSTTSGRCEVFVICNAPLRYGSDTSVETLKEMVVENDFTSQTIQNSFVMSADEIAKVTLTTDSEENRTASGRIRVSRSAAKIQFYLLIPNEFEDEENHLWEPVLSAGVTISMENAVKRGKVDGDYSVQNTDYVSYGPRALTELPAGQLISGREEYTYTHVPFYSYPCSWSDLSDFASSIVFRMAWKRKEAQDYSWKKYQLSPNISTLSLERNHYYRTFVRVNSLGGADKESQVVIAEGDYEILPWMNEDSSAGGQGIVPGEMVIYKYLVVDHPEQTINNETTVYFTYVSSSPVSSVKINSVQYYNNSEADPLKTQSVNATVTADNQTVSTNAGDITVDKATPGVVMLIHSLDDMYSAVTINATITNSDGCTQNVQVIQNPSISLVRELNSGNVFVNGFFSRVSDSPFGNRYQNASDKQYYYYDPRSANNTNWVTPPSPTSNYGTISKGSSGSFNTFFTTLIDITSFNTGNDTYTYTYSGNQFNPEYRIGDPRKRAGEVCGQSWSVGQYLYYNNTTNGALADWTEPLEILVTSQSIEDQSIIAPRFLISSQLNAISTTAMPTFENAVKRAAVYQEAGYPAGRWRIPSEAEMAFIVARQQDGTIPSLFSAGSNYWSGSGRLMMVASSGNSITLSDGGNNTTSVRFVYDLWYWGDDPSTTNVYHPNGHLYNYDSSGNATLIR